MIFIRQLSSQVKRKSVSVVGSGPSGFYTAYHLLSKSPIPLHVTIWEKLPVPFGLSRYGVAPDHPEVKNCEDTFTNCAEQYISGEVNDKNPLGHKFDFIGGVKIGEDVPLKTLIDNQDAVILSYGCGGDKRLGIPGETDTAGVLSSREFVSWYNGHPDFASKEKLNSFDWSRVKNVAIIGNGNVALDITRVLLSNGIPEIWDKTDISKHALNILKHAPIKTVKMIARRDFIHSKFTNKEFRELWELEKYGIKGHISSKYFSEDMFDFEKHQGSPLYDRAFKRRVEMCSEYLKPFDQRLKKNYKKFPPVNPIGKEWELDYLKSPVEIIKDDSSGKIKGLKLTENEVTPDNKVISTGKTLQYEVDLLITSLGYGGIPLQDFKTLDIGFHDSRGHIINNNGKVLDNKGQVVPHLYTSGWIQKGSQGVIASTMMDAFEVGDNVLADLYATRDTYKHTDLAQLLRTHRHTTWFDWQRIDKHERDAGSAEGRPRAKIEDKEEMLEYAQ